MSLEQQRKKGICLRNVDTHVRQVHTQHKHPITEYILNFRISQEKTNKSD